MFDKKYKIIYADPPWKYSDKSLSHGGGAESHYPCMSTKDICDLPIEKITDKNSVLFLWATYPMIPEALKVIKAWGFIYKTVAFTWVKSTKTNSIYMGMGRYTRSNAEICLLSTKGKGCERLDRSIPNTQILKRKAHSEKPAKFRNDIIKLFGDLPRIEIFAREQILGWDSYGNQLPETIQKQICSIRYGSQTTLFAP